MNQKLEIILSGENGDEKIELFGREEKQIGFGNIMGRVVELVNLYWAAHREIPIVSQVAQFVERDEPESEYCLLNGTPYANKKRVYKKTRVVPSVRRGKFYNVAENYLRRLDNSNSIKHKITDCLAEKYPLCEWGENVPIEGAVNIFLNECGYSILKLSKT